MIVSSMNWNEIKSLLFSCAFKDLIVPLHNMNISLQDYKKRQDDLLRAQDFFMRHPEAPKVGTLEVFDLIIPDKDEAMAILQGKQNLVTAKGIPLNYDQLLDYDIDRWIRQEMHKGEDADLMEQYISDVKEVQTMHLHDAADTWYMDVSVIANGSDEYCKESLKELSKLYRCNFTRLHREYGGLEVVEINELLGELADEGKMPDDYKFVPLIFFYFAVDEVLDTNLVGIIPNQPEKMGVNEFFEKYPDAPNPKVLDMVELVIPKEQAKKILKGEKTMLFLPMNSLYSSILDDEEVGRWVDRIFAKHAVDMDDVYEYVDSNCEVSKLRLRDLDGTWHLDVTVSENGYFHLNMDDITALHQEFNCYEFDDELADVQNKIAQGKMDLDHVPGYYFFEIGAVLENKNLS